MASVRQQQTESMLQREFSAVLRAEGSYIYGSKALVTVTGVKLTPDFGEARFYLSVFNREDKQNVIIELDDHTTRLRQQLANRIRKKIRRVPVISFYLDDTLDEMYRLNSLFDQMGTNEDNKIETEKDND
jgi:ribosome-binding factor A